MSKRSKPSTTTHYYRDGRAIVEVLHEVEGQPLYYVYLQERPEMTFAGVFRDVPMRDRTGVARVRVKPRDVKDHGRLRDQAREAAMRALAQGPLRRLIAALARCYYSGAEHWRCLAEKHGLRTCDAKADRHEGKE